MRFWLLTLSLFTFPALAAPAGDGKLPGITPAPPGLVYPQARRSEVVDDYHGTPVPDAYRWMEDADSPETQTWVKVQVSLTNGWLKEIPRRKSMRQRIEKLWNYERFGIPYKRGDRYFFSHNDGLQNHSVLYTVDSLKGRPRVVLNPNTLSRDGTVSAPIQSISHDGTMLAYGTSDAGSDWRTLHVRVVDSSRNMTETLHWVKFSSPTWTHDNNGFYYSRYPEPANKLADVNENQRLYYHEIGTPQSKDRLVYQRPDRPKMSFGASINDAGDTLIIYASEGTDKRNRLYIQDLRTSSSEIVKVFDKGDAAYWFLGDKLVKDDRPFFTRLFTKKPKDPTRRYWIYTNKDAPKGRVIAIDPTMPEEEHWSEIIPESEHVLEGISLTGNRLIAKYLVDARSEIVVYSLNGERLSTVPLPGHGSAWGFGGTGNDPETFFAFTGFSTPSRVYRYDTESGKTELWREPKVDFDPDAFETKQIFYKSKDGTKVPMFIMHKKGLVLDGSNPTVLYGYGGFNISLTPGFSISRVVWMEQGGVYAIANLRGGGEYGEEWHKAGTKENKQNVFDDFIAAGEWLIRERYTSTPKLAIMGGSNGGLLVGAAITQRPDLFGAAIPAVGVMDMLRYHKFTIGHAWADDYGTSDDPEMFKVLRAYSPLHNLKPGTSYPPTLVVTAEHDDRVVPAHSFKFAAELQNKHQGENPVLIRIETRAGHGGGMPIHMKMDLMADRWAFLVRALEMETDKEKASRLPPPLGPDGKPLPPVVEGHPAPGPKPPVVEEKPEPKPAPKPPVVEEKPEPKPAPKPPVVEEKPEPKPAPKPPVVEEKPKEE
jgi:prolyl oligopeptidase